MSKKYTIYSDNPKMDTSGVKPQVQKYQTGGKVIDTRVDGKGLVYTYYDTNLPDFAKAPKTSVDDPFKIKDVKQVAKPGELKYYGTEYKDQATKLRQKQMDAYSRRQLNEYIKAGAKAPDEKVSKAKFDIEPIQQARTEYKRAGKIMQSGEFKAPVADKPSGGAASVLAQKADKLKTAVKSQAANFVQASKPVETLKDALKNKKGFNT